MIKLGDRTNLTHLKESYSSTFGRPEMFTLLCPTLTVNLNSLLISARPEYTLTSMILLSFFAMSSTMLGGGAAGALSTKVAIERLKVERYLKSRVVWWVDNESGPVSCGFNRTQN